MIYERTYALNAVSFNVDSALIIDLPQMILVPFLCPHSYQTNAELFSKMYVHRVSI